MDTSGWYGVRCIFSTATDSGATVYEERVTVWGATDVDDAIGQAEAEAVEYAEAIGAEYLRLAQAYVMSDDLAAGSEVFRYCEAAR